MLGNVGILYERLILNQKSEINFLKNQLLANDIIYRDEITFLRRQLSEVEIIQRFCTVTSTVVVKVAE